MTTNEAQKEQDAPFTLYDCYLGPKAGRYALDLEHRVKGEKVDWTGRAEMTFEVSAARLTLPSPGDVHTVYPPVGAAAYFGDTLPYVAFNRRSLPWERSVARATTDGDRRTPWLALVVLTANDLASATLRTAPASALTDTADKAALYSPWTDEALADSFTLTDDEKKLSLKLLELDAGLFRKVCPTRAELRLLAHVREVDTRGKRDGDARATGEYALLMANRLPQTGVHTAAVVSLEGWGAWLDDANYHKDQAKVRLVVLHSWQFTSVEGVGTCAAWVKDRLDVGAFTFGDAHLPADDADLRATLAEGYTPVAWQPDDKPDARTFAWYRGPLAPVSLDAFADDSAPFDKADAALVVDERTGMVDLSYASAWQVGRLAALASSSFADAARAWSQTRHQEAVRLEEIRREHDPGAADVTPRTFGEDLIECLKNLDATEAKPGASLAHVRTMADWLARLALLELVPFRYLVPSDKLLGREQLRVFYLDPRWLDALTDGALSVGVASLKRRDMLRSNRGLVRRALRWLMARQRAVARGEKLTRPGAGALDATLKPLAGFLLRSQLVKSFPGVEIEVWEGSRKLDFLRLDTVAEGVLFGLVEGSPTRVVVREPREGLRFGAVDKKLSERDDKGVTVTGGAKYDVSARGDAQAPGVIDLGALAAQMNKRGRDDLSSALFALQWLLPPQDVEIPWKSPAR
jgi:hypothetical protein